MSFEKTVNKLAGLDAFMRREAKLITGEVIGTYFGEYVSRIYQTNTFVGWKNRCLVVN